MWKHIRINIAASNSKNVDFASYQMCCKHKQACTDLILQPFYAKTVQELLKRAWVLNRDPFRSLFADVFGLRGALVASSVSTQIRDPQKPVRTTIGHTRGTNAQAARDSGYIEILDSHRRLTAPVKSYKAQFEEVKRL